MDHMASRPVFDVLPQVLLDPLPPALGIDRLQIVAMKWAPLQNHMTVDDHKNLQLAPHPVPEHAFGDAVLGCPQHPAGSIDLAEGFGIAFARRSARRPDGVTAGMAQRFHADCRWRVGRGKTDDRLTSRNGLPGGGITDEPG